MAGDITKFDDDYNKSIQVENSVSGNPLNLKGDPTNDNALYTDATVSSSVLPTGASTSAKQLANDHDVTVSNMIPAVETGLATSAKQLADNHQVTVSNPTADPETGLATSDNQTDGSQITQISALSTIYAGTKTVPTGTAETITSTQVIHSVTIKALSTNTVAVYVGPSGVTVSGFELLAGESVSLDVTNLATVFVISGSASQVVRYIAI